MHEFLLRSGLFVGVFTFTLVTVVYGLTIYYVSHRLFQNWIEKSHERVGRVLFRVSASLLALILSISFANQRINYFKLIDSIELEASKIVQIHMDLDILGTQEAKRVQGKIRSYVNALSDGEWDNLFEDPYRLQEFELLTEIYQNLYELKVETEPQQHLKNSMISDAQQVFDLIQIRLYSTMPESNNLMYTTVFGILVCMVLLGIYRPDRLTLIMAGAYLAFLGVVLYFVLLMTTPLEGPLKLEAKPFELLQEIIEQRYS